MRILWIEDQPETKGLASNLFKGLLGLENFEEFDTDLDIQKELDKVFKKNSIHEIKICRSYDEFSRVEKQNFLNYDVFIIDIDLTKKEPKDSKIPIDVERDKFLKKAGFTIWNELTRLGIPEDHLAFVTGNGKDAEEFIEHCKNANIIFLKKENLFNKSESGYIAFRNWLQKKSEDSYIQLRRGILDACGYLSKTEREILFNNDRKTDEEEIEFEYAKNYLNILKGFFLNDFILDKDEKNQKYKIFLQLLSSEWERTFIQKGKPVYEIECDQSEKDKIIQITNLWIMKNLRNTISHLSFDDEITEIDLTFFFILAMRNFFKIDFNIVTEYEKILLHSYKKEMTKELNLNQINKDNRVAILKFVKSQKIKKTIPNPDPEKKIKKTILNLEKTEKISKYKDIPFVETDYYIEMAYAILDPKKNSSIPKSELKKLSKELFYNSFLEGYEKEKSALSNTVYEKIFSLIID